MTIFNPRKGCVDVHYGSLLLWIPIKKVKRAHIQDVHVDTHTQRHTNTESTSVKLRIKEPVNLARFPCQKQPVCTFACTGFRRLFFHTLLFSPDNLMSIVFPSGIKTL